MQRLRLVESPRSEEVRAYQAKVKAIVEESQKALEGHDLDRARQLVADMQTFVLGKLAIQNTKDTDAGRWDAFRLEGMKAALEHAIDKYSNDFDIHLKGATETGYRAGVERSDRILDVAGAPIGMPGISPHEIAIAAMYKPDLIRGYDSYAKEKIGATITKFVRTGRGFTELMGELKGSIDTRGTPFHSVAYRAELITRTEMQRVAEMGSQARAKQFSSEFPEFGAKQGMLLQGSGRANSPCDECREIYDSAPYPGGLWDIGDPDFPDLPVHPNCFPGETMVSPVGDVQVAYRRWYEGEMVTLWAGTPRVKLFTVTPNHPVLTSLGWVPAGEVQEGDHLVCDAMGYLAASELPDANIEHPEAMIQQVFEAAQQIWLVQRVPGTPMDFHHDGQVHEVEIVATEGNLGMKRPAPLLEKASEFSLTPTQNALVQEPGGTGLDPGLLGPCASCHVSAGVAIEASEVQGLGGLHVAALDSSLQEDLPNGASVQSELLRQGEFRHAFLVQADDLPGMLGVLLQEREPNVFGFGSAGDTIGNESASDSVATDAEARSDFSHGLARSVHLTDEVHIEREWFRGHVFNLQTSSGFYTVSGIPVKNCLCASAPWIPPHLTRESVQRRLWVVVKQIREAKAPPQA